MATNNCWNNQISGSYNQIILNAGTNGVAVSTDASAATINIGTGAAVKTTTLGSTNSTSTTTLNAGSGGVNVSNFLALPTSTSSSTGIIKIGPNFMIHNYGADSDSNIFIGKTAGNFTLTSGTATNNTAIGRSALNALTTGLFNTVIGDGVSPRLTQGQNNTALGSNTADVTTGSYNIAIGSNALSGSLTSESSNIYIGYNTAGTASLSNRLLIGSGTGTGNGQLNSAVINGISAKSTAAASNVMIIDSNSVLGTVAGGAVTFNTGTQSLSISTDASATTVNIATGAAVKTVTLGSTNSTSSTAIKSGSGNIVMNSGFTVRSNGVNTNTVQPGFSAYLNAATANTVTGDGTTYTVVCNTSLFDNASNYSTSTGAFTAPVAGVYFFTFACMIANIGSQSTYQLQITTATQAFQGAYCNPSTMKANGNFLESNMAVAIKLSASDTVQFSIVVAGGTKTIGVNGGGPLPSQQFTYVSGFLLG